MINPPAEVISEEIDQLHKSIKKYKRLLAEDGTEEINDSRSININVGEYFDNFNDVDMTMDQDLWKGPTFANIVRTGPIYPPIYTGEDEVDEYDDVDLTFI